MQPTWKEDLLSLHLQRKNYIKSLRYLYEQSSRVSRVSVTTHNEIEVTKERLQEVEKRILLMQESLGNVVEQEGLRKIDGFSPYLSSGQNSDADEAENLDVLLDGNRTTKTSKHKKLWFYAVIIFVVIIIVAVVMFVLARPYFGSKIPASSVSSEISIYEGYYHIGDAPVQQFHTQNPQPNPFIATFQLSSLGKSPHLVLTASHVDPNIAQSPVLILINDNLVGYLNNYFAEESLSPKQVSIPVDLTFLQIGENKIQIDTQATINEYQTPNLDDFEFWGLKLEFEKGN